MDALEISKHTRSYMYSCQFAHRVGSGPLNLKPRGFEFNGQVKPIHIQFTCTARLARAPKLTRTMTEVGVTGLF